MAQEAARLAFKSRSNSPYPSRRLLPSSSLSRRLRGQCLVGSFLRGFSKFRTLLCCPGRYIRRLFQTQMRLWVRNEADRRFPPFNSRTAVQYPHRLTTNLTDCHVTSTVLSMSLMLGFFRLIPGVNFCVYSPPIATSRVADTLTLASPSKTHIRMPQMWD